MVIWLLYHLSKWFSNQGSPPKWWSDCCIHQLNPWSAIYGSWPKFTSWRIFSGSRDHLKNHRPGQSTEWNCKIPQHSCRWRSIITYFARNWSVLQPNILLYYIYNWYIGILAMRAQPCLLSSKNIKCNSYKCVHTPIIEYLCCWQDNDILYYKHSKGSSSKCQQRLCLLETMGFYRNLVIYNTYCISSQTPPLMQCMSKAIIVLQYSWWHPKEGIPNRWCWWSHCLSKLSIPSLNHRREVAAFTTLYKMHTAVCQHVNLHALLHLSYARWRVTLSSLFMSVHAVVNTHTLDRCFIHSVARVWNSLPERVVGLQAFKYRAHRHLKLSSIT